MPTVPTLKEWFLSKAFLRTLVSLILKVSIHWFFVGALVYAKGLGGGGGGDMDDPKLKMSGTLISSYTLQFLSSEYPVNGQLWPLGRGPSGLSVNVPPYYGNICGIGLFSAYECIPTFISMTLMLDDHFFIPYTICFNCGCVISYCLCAYYITFQSTVVRKTCKECHRYAPINEYKNRCPSCNCNGCSLECLLGHYCIDYSRQYQRETPHEDMAPSGLWPLQGYGL